MSNRDVNAPGQGLVVALIAMAAFVLAGFEARAAEIKGTVRAVTGETVTVAVEGDVVPGPGDKVEIFFTLPGGDDEVSVGHGKVSAVNPDSIEVKIDAATGTVERNHHARITSANPQKRIPQPQTTSSPGVPANGTVPAQTAAGRDPSFVFLEMNRVFRDHPKTKMAEAKINDAKNLAKKEYDARRARKESEAQLAVWRSARERELEIEAQAMRREIVQDMTAVIERMTAGSAGLVLDTSGMSLNGVPVVLSSPSGADVTARIAPAFASEQPGRLDGVRGLKVGLVDMSDVFKNFNKTKEAEAKINADRNAAKIDYDKRAESYTKERAKVDSLSAAARNKQTAKLQKMEREINDFRTSKEKQLQEEAMKMREGIVTEITNALKATLVTGPSDLILDKSGRSENGAPLILWSSGIPDLSQDLVGALNNPAANSKTSSAPPQSASTAGLRVGRVDMKRACIAMPETRQAEKEIEELRSKAKIELATADASAREAREKELQAIAQSRREMITQKVIIALGPPAEAGGFNLIFDSSGLTLNRIPLLVSTHDVPDLTDQLLAKLAATAP